MSDLLAIVGPDEDEEQLLAEIAAWRPRRVTLLVSDASPGWAYEDSGRAVATRELLARLLGEIELRTGAAVVGLAGDPEQLLHWRFDHVVGGRATVAA
jgi:hypothetical protein